ncbi:hypothetical protein [Streptomyces lydicus]|uniref:hypothetical protein n=1 Tax=Streptomyces lydicus TaxID=47763 RepID=UPI0037B5DA96
MAATRTDQQQTLSEALTQIHTPDSFGRAIIANALKSASKQMREKGDGPVEITRKIYVSFQDSAEEIALPKEDGGDDGWGPPICMRIQGILLCF